MSDWGTPPSTEEVAADVLGTVEEWFPGYTDSTPTAPQRQITYLGDGVYSYAPTWSSGETWPDDHDEVLFRVKVTVERVDSE